MSKKSAVMILVLTIPFAAGGLLGLLRIDADPVQSREQILSLCASLVARGKGSSRRRVSRRCRRGCWRIA